MRVARTTVASEVSSVIGQPGVVGEIWDMAGEPVVPLHETIYHLLAKDTIYIDGAAQDIDVGVVTFMPINSVTWNPHVAIIPEYQGCGVGTEIVREGIAWMFENTPCRKIVANPPAFKKSMIRVFEKCGLKIEGYSPRSFLWRGELCDRFLMGLERN